MTIAAVVLWVLIGCCLYTMFGYPLLMFVLGSVFRRTFTRQPITPPVTLVIAAYNEEKAIGDKLENSLSLDYPRDKLEITVASDASTDRTDEIVRSYAERGVKLFRAEGNLGKSTMLNEAVKQAGGEIIAFSDATGMWSKQAIRAMAAHYADPRVACVSGWVAYRYDDSLTAQGFGVYQRFVMALRRAEAAFGAMYNTPGSIHSVRKSAFIPSPPATFLDMADPFHTAKQGLRITFEPEAISWEESRIRTQDEWVARVRICLRAWTFLFYALPRLPLLRSPMYCFQLLSHKILRWMVGPLLIPIFILNAVLFTEHWVYQLLFAAQVLYYFLTVLGLLLARLGLRVKLLSGLVFFNSVNLAYLLSALKYLRGERIARWKPTR